MLVGGDHGQNQYKDTVSFKIILGQVTDVAPETSVYSPFNHLKASGPRKFYLIQSP
jgi:hypothetical protein